MDVADVGTLHKVVCAFLCTTDVVCMTSYHNKRKRFKQKSEIYGSTENSLRKDKKINLVQVG